MKQRLMALTIDFKQAFTTVALITVNGSISQHDECSTLRICERYIGLIQLLDRKEWLKITDEQVLAIEIDTIEYHFRMQGMNDVYCPWAENTSIALQAELDEMSDEEIETVREAFQSIADKALSSIVEKVDALLSVKQYSPGVVNYEVDENASFNEENLVTSI